ncbi:hypothetical protein [Nocardia lijiangensis]|uniref:hypothetical protein n=1 Tax=Nocardia lijiangensis TaxID=299618 RepID=UPI00082F7E3B|nr:hypothetical protein [Nocardia lijiangensis]
MASTQIDYGQAQINAFNEAARAGVIHYDESVVREAVRLYDSAIQTFMSVRDRMQDGMTVAGFGGFQSGLELQNGFLNKAQEGIGVINQLIEGAMRLQEAYLRAGNLIEEADQINARALTVAANAIPGDMRP